MKSWPKIDGALADYVDANWLRESPVKRRLRDETAKLDHRIVSPIASRRSTRARTRKRTMARI